ncbi:MAG TPA: ABC transporter ATP-binding protein [Gemmatimonadales bacterium]|nr:ABC transporter ATP-binding protein [Gemmatimonadales bacterium]
MSDAAPVVEFRRVTKSFGSTPAVNGVSFSVRRGEFFSLLGPSGCGKTTTLRLLAGFEAPDPGGGEVCIDGEVVNDRRPYERRIGMVFQNYALFPHLSVERNVAFGLEEHRVPKGEVPGRVARALELVRLAPATFARRRPHQLSGGQRQRVALARALVLEPSILLLDEPLGALDLQLRKEMQLELKALNRQLGMTFVYVTHDQEEALAMSDRIAVMSAARIAQLGTPAEVYENPRTEFVAGFIGVANIFGGRLGEGSSGGGAPRSVRRDDGRTLLVPDAPSVPAGAPVRIAVRPEWLDLAPPEAPPPGENTLPGVVEEVVYLGETMHVVVTLDDGHSVRVALRNEGQLGNPLRWRRGELVLVAWRPEDCQVLEPE